MTVDYVALGETVRNLRKAAGLTQEELAEFCDISTSFMGHIERGSRKLSLETLLSLSYALRVTPDILLSSQVPFLQDNPAAFLSTLTFHSPEQKEAFYRAVRALAKGRDSL